MRGDDRHPDAMFSYVAPEQRVPADHPLRAIRAMVDTALRELSPEFARLYPKTGRPSIPPEKLLRALLLQMLYSVRSERQLMEQLDYNLLFRWFVGLSMDDPVWDPTVFTKNRERLLRGDIARAFFERVLAQAQGRQLLSGEHFTVDGTLIEAWAGLKSFKPKGAPAPPPDDPGNPTVNFHGERRSNATHASTTDPEARLSRKSHGHEAKLAYQGHVLMENRHGLVVDTCVSQATGSRSGRRPWRWPRTCGAAPPWAATRAMTRAASSPPSARWASRRMSRRTPRRRASAIDDRTTRHAGYAVSQQKRKRVEEVFGWVKTVALLRKTRHRGRATGRVAVHPGRGAVQPGADPERDRGGGDG